MKNRKSVEKIATALLMVGCIGITGGFGNFEVMSLTVKAENLEKRDRDENLSNMWCDT